MKNNIKINSDFYFKGEISAEWNSTFFPLDSCSEKIHTAGFLVVCTLLVFTIGIKDIFECFMMVLNYRSSVLKPRSPIIFAIPALRKRRIHVHCAAYHFRIFSISLFCLPLY